MEEDKAEIHKIGFQAVTVMEEASEDIITPKPFHQKHLLSVEGELKTRNLKDVCL